MGQRAHNIHSQQACMVVNTAAWHQRRMKSSAHGWIDAYEITEWHFSN